MSSKMDEIIDKVADAGEKVQQKMSHADTQEDTAGEAPTGAHRGDAADEPHKPGIMDKIADATEKLVDKFDHSDDPAASTAITSTPPVEIPAGEAHMDPTGKVV